jgi:TolB-like protein/DNA-binding winged helix-turn-helix (wHTH) protein/tetratricopeptide (TPR) repeat protein
VDPRDGTLSSGGSTRRVEPQVMDLLQCLITHPGEVVSRQQIVDRVWQGRIVSEDSLTGCVSQLRKAMGDDARTPRYLETIPKRGYRLLMPSEDCEDGIASSTLPLPARRRWRRAMAFAGTAVVCAGLVTAWWKARAPDSLGSLVVLPLKSVSADPNDAYLAEGVTSALTTEMARLSGLRVISHTSALRYSGTSKAAPDIRKELGVDAILEGSVSRSEERVRIDVQLIDARRDAHLWAAAYEREFGGLLRLQEEIAGSVAARIGVPLWGASGGNGGSPAAVPAAALETYLKGRAALDQRTPESLRQSSVYFRQAIEADPGLAGAYAGLAESSMFMIVSETVPASELSAEARAAALKALKLSPNSGEAHASWAAVIGFIDWRLPASEAEFRRALQLQPGLASAHLGYALVLTALGRHEEATAQGREALKLDPYSLPARWSLAEVLIAARRYEEAVAELRAALTLNPAYSNAHFGIAIASFLAGDERQAWSAYRSGLGSQGVAKGAVDDLNAAFSRQGMAGVFGAVARYLERQPVQAYATRRSVLLYYCLAGEGDRAFPLLEQTLAERSPLLLWFPRSPYAERLGGDSRLERFLERLSVEAHPDSGLGR